ncbi:hypothetical protein SAMN04515620_1771 [Collimonas sp. OK607]|uniref:StbB family protein n=1 Tax=Collimonas sp. OK607 TaxID=1798194 RepID=UPI0008EF0258|nr:StbB family protein [Collimonas sp. OK607]SFB41790.1 hypothetical protein SAMN04515620_1771 [Collimonas sp. OK607]
MKKNIKIAVINFSGNVGKSTISDHLLSPRLNNAPVIPVESINSDGLDRDQFRGKQFGEILETLGLMDDAIIDVGASNVEDFILFMTQYHGSHEDFDYFVVPTVANLKQQRDTISTIGALSDIGVPANKIRIVFNMMGSDEQVERVFSPIFAFYEEEKSFQLTSTSRIHLNDIFGKLRGANQTIAGILNDETDYRAQLKAATTPEDKLKITRSISLK